MKSLSLSTVLVSLLSVACGGNTINTASSSGTAGSTTGGSTGSGTTGSASATAGSTTGDAGCVYAPVPGYPGNQCTWSVAQTATFPDVSLSGGLTDNLGATTATKDSTTGYLASFDFGQLHALAAQGFRYAFIDVSAVWCPNCQDEATVLPGMYPQWLSQGGVILSVLVQAQDGVHAAVPQDLTNWINTYKVNYPMTLDSQQDMVNSLGLTGWPSNVIIRLSDMTVLFNGAGQGTTNYDAFEADLLYCAGANGGVGLDAGCWNGATCTNNQCH